ncbi:unnamed protein product, partial [Iphiclides podalirius]
MYRCNVSGRHIRGSREHLTTFSTEDVNVPYPSRSTVSSVRQQQQGGGDSLAVIASASAEREGIREPAYRQQRQDGGDSLAAVPSASAMREEIHEPQYRQQ